MFVGHATKRGARVYRRILIAAYTSAALLSGSACAGSSQTKKAKGARDIVQMEELRITAKRGEAGYQFQTYDAADLFARATDLLNKQQCKEAVALYDQLVAEFSESRYASAALYNAGLCLQALAEFDGSAQRYGGVRERYPESEDKKDASFQLAEVLVQLARFDQVIEVADELLAREDLSADERLEGMARRAQGLLGAQRLEEAERYAQGALSFYRTRPAGEKIKDDFFAAACNYVLAETYRQRGEAMAFPEGVEEQKKVLVRRAELLLETQREYFNTISLNNLSNYHWAAASGYRIGSIYDQLWHAVMNAPVPANLPREGHDVYHKELAKLIKPLMRHAIRYWELTQMFIERTGITTPWAEKIKTDLERVRNMLLEQPLAPQDPAAAPAPAELPNPRGPEGRPAPTPAAPTPATVPGS